MLFSPSGGTFAVVPEAIEYRAEMFDPPVMRAGRKFPCFELREDVKAQESHDALRKTVSKGNGEKRGRNGAKRSALS